MIDMSDHACDTMPYAYREREPSAQEMEYLRTVQLPNSRPRRIREAVMSDMPRLTREICNRMSARALSASDVAEKAQVRKTEVETLLAGRPASLRTVRSVLKSLDLSTPVYPPEVMRFGA